MRASSVIVLLLAAAGAFAQEPAPELIVLNGRVWTMDATQPEVEAVAVMGGRIYAVGTTEAMGDLAGPETRVIDADGRRVLPGFIDNHTHFMSGSYQLQSVDLRHAENERAFAELIRTRSTDKPGKWITGGDWDHDNWPGGNLPTKELIDGFTASTPVFVNRYDYHMALANSYVLTMAGITKDTPDPSGGTIVRDPKTGEPTGVLKDEAMSLVYAIMPSDSFEDMLDAVRLGLVEARTWGVTSIQDAGSGQHMKVYTTLKRNGELTARFHCRLPIYQWKQLASSGVTVPFGDEWIRIGSLKGFADGSLGSTTALFYEPYDSDPTTRGLPMDGLLDGSLEKQSLLADEAGLQLSIHAIGDSANSRILDIFEKVVETNPAWDRRFRIEHAQHIHPRDFKRFAELRVIASVQPYHAIDDGRWAEGRIGHERGKTTYPFKSFLDNGIKLSFGSDWTVGPLNPILGIYAAVTRQTTDGKNPGGWFPEQKITVEQAIEAYTITNAYAVFEEDEKGSITPGKLADIIILSDDILTIDPVDIQHVTVEVTIVDGHIVYEKE